MCLVLCGSSPTTFLASDSSDPHPAFDPYMATFRGILGSELFSLGAQNAFPDHFRDTTFIPTQTRMAVDHSLGAIHPLHTPCASYHTTIMCSSFNA